VVDGVEEADFVLAHGTEALGKGDGKEPQPVTLEVVRQLLGRAAAKDLPLLVANPDLVTVDGDTLRIMPGTFAKWYSEMGGKVSVANHVSFLHFCLWEACEQFFGKRANQPLWMCLAGLPVGEASKSHI
jgi:hypothetical protein